MFPGMVAGKFPLDEIQFLPPMDYLCYRPTRVYADLYNQFPEVGAQYDEVKFLWQSTETGTFMSSGQQKLITKLEDFDGLKMLVAGGTQALRLEALGAVPVPLPPTEVYSALEKGTVDAQPVTLKTLVAFGWAEVQHYLYLVRLTGMSQAFVMNMDTWNSLPPDIQKIFEDLGNEHMVDVVDKGRWQIYHEMVRRLVDEFGMEIVDIPPEEVARWQEAAQAGTDIYTAQLEEKGLPGKAFVDAYYQLDKKYSSSEYEYISK
jgi:TRAP-type C4-dicarboxylate transport system substrate-binding protein